MCYPREPNISLPHLQEEIAAENRLDVPHPRYLTGMSTSYKYEIIVQNHHIMIYLAMYVETVDIELLSRTCL